MELGERLAGRGVLIERDDIFFVELSELRPLVAGAALDAKIAARKADFAYNGTIVPPPVVVGQFDPETMCRRRRLFLQPACCTGWRRVPEWQRARPA